MEEKQDEVKLEFLRETQEVMETIKKSPKNSEFNLNLLSSHKDVSLILGYITINKLYNALENIYKGICDKRITYQENVTKLVILTCTKIEECCALVEVEDTDELDVQLYLLYCDKATADEIFDLSPFSKNHAAHEQKQEKKNLDDEKVSVDYGSINKILHENEEMIARTYKIDDQIDRLKIIQDDLKISNRRFTEIQKQLKADMQILQTSLSLEHEQFISFMGTEGDVSLRYQDYHGFFVFANGRKYLIPAEYIMDVTYESSLNYVEKQNQLYLVQVSEDDVDAKKYIPIYSLSSLFPGQKAAYANDIDTILIAEYSGQQIGIITESVQKYVTLTKKPMPNAFRNFSILQGVTFDEKYDMIPILYIPEILKRFRAQRGYDVKKFEANTKKRIFKILVVDDSDTTRGILKTILYGNGYLVDMAVDGIAGLEEARAHQYDLIITDDDMPKMNGQIFLDNLRRMENYVHVPVVAMAGGEIDKSDAFIDKADFKRSALIDTIKELLHE